MNTHTNIAVSDPRGELYHELAHLQKKWWAFLLLGALLVLCGIVAIAYPFVTSVSVVVVLGAVLLVAGMAMIVSSFWTGNWSAFLIQLLIGILYIVVGLLTMESPLEATAALTLLVAGLFIVAGIFRMVASITLRFPQWGWVCLNGAISLIFGIIIYKHFPESALWLIGILFGIDLLFNGITWIMLSLEIRNADLTDVTPEATPAQS